MLECDFVAGCDGSQTRTRYLVLRPHAVLPAVSVRLVRHPRRSAADLGGADLRPPRARLRAGEHALPDRAADVLAGRPHRLGRRLARRPDLGGADDPRVRRRLQVVEGTDLRQVGAAVPQLRLRADAVRPAVPRRRRRPHGSADRRQGHEPRRGRRVRAQPRHRRPLPHRRRPRPGVVHRDGAAADLARSTSRTG